MRGSVLNYKNSNKSAISVYYAENCETTNRKSLRFAYKPCVSFAKVAFRLQIVRLKLQTCTSFTKYAFHFTNAASRFTIQQVLLNNLKNYVHCIDKLHII